MKNVSTKKSTIIVTLLTLISAVLGFGRESYIAYAFGSTEFTDVYYVAGIVPDIVAGWIGYTLTKALIPSLKSELMVAQNSSKHLITASFYITLVAATALTVLCYIYKANILSLLAPNFHEQQYIVGTKMLEIMVVAIIFSALSGVLGGIHNSVEEFSYPALTGIAYNFLYLGFIICFQPLFGIYALAYGLLVGIIGKFLVQFVPLVREKVLSLEFKFKHEKLPLVFLAMIPVFFSQIVTQINQIVDRIIATGLPPGEISNLNFASKLGLLPIGLIGASFATTLYTRFVTYYLQKDIEQIKRLLTLALGWMVFLGMIISTGFYLYNKSLISIFYYNGNFTIKDVVVASKPLAVYGGFSIIYLFIPVLVHFFYSRNEGRFVLLSSIVSVASNIVLSILLVKYLGIVGLVLANGVAQTIYMLLLYGSSLKHLKWKLMDSAKEILKLGLPGGGIFLVVVFLISHLWGEPALENKVMLIARGTISLLSGVVGVFVYAQLDKTNLINQSLNTVSTSIFQRIYRNRK